MAGQAMMRTCAMAWGARAAKTTVSAPMKKPRASGPGLFRRCVGLLGAAAAVRDVVAQQLGADRSVRILSENLVAERHDVRLRRALRERRRSDESGESKGDGEGLHVGLHGLRWAVALIYPRVRRSAVICFTSARLFFATRFWSTNMFPTAV